MFGLSWDQIILILLAALFLLGPERIPTAVQWVMGSVRKLRTMAAGAQDELRSQIGPELDEMRRQIAELQSLKELQELRQLRELNPRTIIGKNILGDEFSGGVKGFLGLTGTGPADAAGANGAASDGAGGNGGDAAAGGSVGGGDGAVRSANGGDGAVGWANGGDGPSAAAPSPGASASMLTATREQRILADGETPPFDIEGT